MGTIYLVNILHKILIYSKCTVIDVTIILRPFAPIIIFEYTFNMVVHIHSKYTFINPNTFSYILYNSQNTPLYTHGFVTKLVTFATNGTQIVLFKWKPNYMLFTWKDEHQNSHKLVVV